MAWQEIGDRVFTRKYPFFNQQIGVVLGGSDVLVVDTRSTPAQAREIASELRELTRDPVSIVVDTHWHFDHSFGNSVFRPATIWGHIRAAEQLRREGAATIGGDYCIQRTRTQVMLSGPPFSLALSIRR